MLRSRAANNIAIKEKTMKKGYMQLFHAFLISKQDTREKTLRENIKKAKDQEGFLKLMLIEKKKNASN